jgi:hypothetical protein
MRQTYANLGARQIGMTHEGGGAARSAPIAVIADIARDRHIGKAKKPLPRMNTDFDGLGFG